MTQSALVTIVVVNWNGRAYLDQCLDSLLAQSYQPREIILVDNGSTDGSPDHVEAHYPAVQVMRLPRNIGFAGANNAAIQQSAGAYIALLNNDAYVEPGWLEAMVHVADQDPRVGMIACKMLFADAPNMIQSTGLALDWAGFCWDWQGGQADDPAETQIEERFGPTGGAALYRRAMLDHVGLFDQDFFLYAEDADLAWRAQRSGWRCLYVPAARVYHAVSATAGAGSRFKNFLLGRSKVWLLAKNVPGGWRMIWIGLLLAYDLLAVGYGILARCDWGAVQGRLAGLWGLPHMIRKRGPTRTLDYLQLIKPLEPPWKIHRRFEHLARRAE